MKATVKLPKVADTADNVVISEILVAPGQSIAEGDVLMSVETDKAMVEVPAPVAGVIVDVLVSVDDEIVTGAPIVTIEVG
jgi:pyruvate/2-oxoglutarate dehydrogenase complex dihydrolipoamide acyltransferase (E2) component